MDDWFTRRTCNNSCNFLIALSMDAHFLFSILFGATITSVRDSVLANVSVWTLEQGVTVDNRMGVLYSGGSERLNLGDIDLGTNMCVQVKECTGMLVESCQDAPTGLTQVIWPLLPTGYS